MYFKVNFNEFFKLIKVNLLVSELYIEIYNLKDTTHLTNKFKDTEERCNLLFNKISHKKYPISVPHFSLCFSSIEL